MKLKLHKEIQEKKNELYLMIEQIGEGSFNIYLVDSLGDIRGNIATISKNVIELFVNLDKAFKKHGYDTLIPVFLSPLYHQDPDTVEISFEGDGRLKILKG